MANGAINRRRAGRPGPPQPGDNERRGRLNGKRQRQPCVGEDDPVLPNPGWVTHRWGGQSRPPLRRISCPCATNDAIFRIAAVIRRAEVVAPYGETVSIRNQRTHSIIAAGIRAAEGVGPDGGQAASYAINGAFSPTRRWGTGGAEPRPYEHNRAHPQPTHPFNDCRRDTGRRGRRPLRRAGRLLCHQRRLPSNPLPRR